MSPAAVAMTTALHAAVAAALYLVSPLNHVDTTPDVIEVTMPRELPTPEAPQPLPTPEQPAQAAAPPPAPAPAPTPTPTPTPRCAWV